MQMETFPQTEPLRVSLFLPSRVWLCDILKLRIIRYAVKMCISCKMSALTWKGWEPRSLWMSFNTVRFSVNISLISLSFLLQVRLWVGRWKCFLSLIWSNSDCYVGNVKMSTHRAGWVACDYRQSRLLPEAAITPLICFLHWSHLNFALYFCIFYVITGRPQLVKHMPGSTKLAASLDGSWKLTSCWRITGENRISVSFTLGVICYNLIFLWGDMKQ